MKRKYTDVELMACAASRLLEDKKSVFVGTGLPMVACALAQRTHAPNLLVVFEAGGIGPQSTAQLGYVDYGFLGGAQIDKYGNLNTTVIGSYKKFKVRLPGSGGGNDVGSLCWRNIILMRQNKRKFVENVDFITTPGYLNGPGAREKAGLPANTGPYRVITQLGIMGFDEKTKQMKLGLI